MQLIIDQLKTIRQRFTDLCSSVSEEQLFEIPPGFRNHIAWNVGHVLVTQQLLTYGLSGLELKVAPELVEHFKKGSSPADWPDHSPWNGILDRLVSGVEDFGRDWEEGRFASFESYTTSAGVTLSTLEEAATFNHFHEGIHLGYCLALKRALASHSG